jgi:nucleoid-associated protein YgaU
MGMLDFIKDAGAKVLAAASDPVQAAKDIKQHVYKETGLNDDIQVVWNDGTVKVSGTAATQEAKEKLLLAAGNIHGVGKVEDAVSVAAPAPESRMYTVQKGDTLSAIAKHVYGNANEYTKIFKANQPLLKDPDKIYPGQMLRIP